MTRDSRLKRVSGETGTGSIGVADESGGARSAIAQPQPTNPKTPNTHIGRIVEGLSDSARKALMGSHRLSDFSTERAVYHRCPEAVLDELWNCSLIKGSRYVTSLGLSVRTYLESMEGGMAELFDADRAFVRFAHRAASRLAPTGFNHGEGAGQ